MTKEQVYDLEINPLMAEIIRICKENRIAFVASFAFDQNPDVEDDQMLCTSCLLEDDCEPPVTFMEAKRLIVKGPTLTAITITRDPQSK